MARGLWQGSVTGDGEDAAEVAAQTCKDATPRLLSSAP